MLLRCVIGLLIIVFGYVSVAVANPQDYPEFAQQKVQDNIPIQFIKAETLKQHLDEKTAQVIMDVRSHNGYAKRHLPGAPSIPLRLLPDRVAEIPREVPVVLY
jgi:hypothetical protein